MTWWYYSTKWRGWAAVHLARSSQRHIAVSPRHSSSGSSMESDPVPDPPNPPAVIQERKGQRKYQNVVLDIIASLYLKPDYSDLKIFCQDRVFPAHKLVLCPRSKYFQSACCGSFEESQGSVTLDTRSPTLVERMLQFLYTGDYTVEDNTTEVQISPGDSDKLPEPDTWHSEAALRLSQRDQNDVENLSAEDNAVDQIAMSMSNQLAASLMDPCSVNKRTSVTGEGPLTGSSEQMDAIDESLTDCHPCYFHLRMYGEADYFLIKDPKIRAAENFRDSFENCSEKQILARVIKELYSTNADYGDIRNSVIELIVKNLRKLHGGLTPEIDYDLLKAYPAFAAELCIATMEKYLSVSSSPRKVLPLSTVEYKPFKFKNFEYP